MRVHHDLHLVVHLLGVFHIFVLVKHCEIHAVNLVMTDENQNYAVEPGGSCAEDHEDVHIG